MQKGLGALCLLGAATILFSTISQATSIYVVCPEPSSVAISITGEDTTMRRLYFVSYNEFNDKDQYVYLWNSSENNATWPGEKINYLHWYNDNSEDAYIGYFDIDFSKWVNLIVSSGSYQTSDLVISDSFTGNVDTIKLYINQNGNNVGQIGWEFMSTHIAATSTMKEHWLFNNHYFTDSLLANETTYDALQIN